MRMGHWAWGIGHWALGIGHWALGIENRQRGKTLLSYFLILPSPFLLPDATRTVELRATQAQYKCPMPHAPYPIPKPC
ncbi:rRNA small subunit methyltransferase H [Nostoc flagelliforme CCNUN1]|uniref:rRNA small subunit methyltransferase H n=1 Tax=Nostoc flagelliforme CCNUN1 TaxID=2038116 RepID=A0A2K8T573_9NOSO|nr:rRNA small subunit methyltransferase H [Nostoc flagelliforme CCNUN1]